LKPEYRILSLILISFAFGILAYAPEIAQQIPPQFVTFFGIVIFTLREVIKELGIRKEEIA
jgi:hypothetical protein